MDEKTASHRMVSGSLENARDLAHELAWFARVLDTRIKLHFDTDSEADSIFEIEPPDLGDSTSPYAHFVRHYDISFAERIVVMLALIPHIHPQMLDVLWSRNEQTGRGFTEFGGLHGTSHGGFLPSGETAAFILAGDDLAIRFELARLFDGDHFFAHHNIVQLTPVAAGEPVLSGALTISQEYLHWFTTAVERKPSFNTEFPARLIETELEWNELVLPTSTLEQLEEIRHWITHGDRLLREWEMHKRLPPGYTSLFYGPPGTGKTLAASLLAKELGLDLYKIDLSMMISKYIGETEKNLARIFDRAQHKRWILFFDEADALFGKRTRVDDSHDRYANQEISFLLQRIEEFAGVVILASNLKANIDDAFIRRFQSVVFFPMPKPSERLRIWKKGFSPRAELENKVDLSRLAEKHDLSGGTIMNVVRYASLKALSRQGVTIFMEDLEEGVRREFMKEGRTL